MNTILKILFTFYFLMISACAVIGAEHPELKAFPAAKAGKQRFVVTLPHKERGEEDDFMVELITGKTLMTDGVNVVRLGNRIEVRTLKGWGYHYYEVTGPSSVMSTLMAAPENAPKVKAFVRAPSIKVRYNSRLPIVVYVPEGYEVQYRVWKASGQTFQVIE